jgi:phage terminase large subunit-like protein
MVQYIQGGKYILSAANDKTVKVWDASVQSVENTDYQAEQGIVRKKKYIKTKEKEKRIYVILGALVCF